MSMASLNPVDETATAGYIGLSFAACGLLLAPVLWHFKHNNSGAACLGLWILIGNLIHGINGAVWRYDALNRAPIWCDISAKVILVYPCACLLSALAIARFVAVAVSPGATHITARGTRRMNIMNYSACFGFPILIMAGHIIYQPNRFSIFRTVGCEATYAISWPIFILWMIWPPIIAFVAAAYAAYTVRRIWVSRREMRRLIETAGMPTSRFLRLVAMCCGYTAFALPLALYGFALQLRFGGGEFYYLYSWDFIHNQDHDFNTPTLAPLQAAPAFNDYQAVMGACVYIVFFSFSREAGSVYSAILARLGLLRFVPRWPVEKKILPQYGPSVRVTEISLTYPDQLQISPSLKHCDKLPGNESINAALQSPDTNRPCLPLGGDLGISDRLAERNADSDTELEVNIV